MTRASDVLLDAAASIGQTLCNTAYWHDGRCNWVGRSSREAGGTAAQLQITPTVAALGPEFYGGSAGVGLFLAQLHQLRPHRFVVDTARGAARHALRKSADLPTQVARSFHSGPIGIAFAAATIAQLTGDTQLVDEALELARRAAASLEGEGLLDVIGGSAGVIAPLLALSRLHGIDSLRQPALALADELRGAATQNDGAWCWDNDRACGKGVGPTPLCGFAHGASGMGLSLIEAGSVCGRSDWIDGGLAAFAYEDRLYDTAHRNWPDLRDLSNGASTTAASDSATPLRPQSRAPSFMVAWCHGAAGIGLARLRALQLLPARASEVVGGVDRAVACARTQLDALPAGSDATLCHGRGGLAETLLLESTIRGDARQRRATVQMWTRLLKARGDDPEWPSGVPSGGSNPSLMLGLAGVGYSLLRAAAPERVPSVLMIGAS